MKDYTYPYPWKGLSGTAEEMRFLAARFAEMSAREQHLVEGASQLQSIDTAADLIDLTEQLDCFAFYYGAADDGKLGDYIAKYRENATYAQLPFFDFARWGKDVREQHGGVFLPLYQSEALWLDLRDVMGNTGKEGLHLAGMGETWQAASAMGKVLVR